MQEVDEGPSESDYNFALTRVAVAQICQSMGFKAAQNSALNTLADIAGRYLRAIAKSAATTSTNSSGRTQSNLFDIIVALEDLGSVQGFKGGSETNVHCVLTSSSLVELQRFLKYTDEIPFSKPLPRIVYGEVDMGVREGSEGRLSYVPRWLPAMPVMGEGEEERKGEGKWEEGKWWGGEKEEGKWEGLPEEKRRGKVRNKMMGGKEGGDENELRSGVCRSGGIGKRVLCENEWNNGGSEEEVGKRKVIMNFKKRLK